MPAQLVRIGSHSALLVALLSLLFAAVWAVSGVNAQSPGVTNVRAQLYLTDGRADGTQVAGDTFGLGLRITYRPGAVDQIFIGDYFDLETSNGLSFVGGNQFVLTQDDPWTFDVTEGGEPVPIGTRVSAVSPTTYGPGQDSSLRMVCSGSSTITCEVPLVTIGGLNLPIVRSQLVVQSRDRFGNLLWEDADGNRFWQDHNGGWRNEGGFVVGSVVGADLTRVTEAAFDENGNPVLVSSYVPMLPPGASGGNGLPPTVKIADDAADGDYTVTVSGLTVHTGLKLAVAGDPDSGWVEIDPIELSDTLTVTVAPPSPPDDFSLELTSLADADLTVAAGSSVEVGAIVSYVLSEDPEHPVAVAGAKLRVSGGFEFESNGRSSADVDSAVSSCATSDDGDTRHCTVNLGVEATRIVPVYETNPDGSLKLYITDPDDAEHVFDSSSTDHILWSTPFVDNPADTDDSDGTDQIANDDYTGGPYPKQKVEGGVPVTKVISETTEPTIRIPVGTPDGTTLTISTDGWRVTPDVTFSEEATGFSDNPFTPDVDESIQTFATPNFDSDNADDIKAEITITVGSVDAIGSVDLTAKDDKTSVAQGGSTTLLISILKGNDSAAEPAQIASITIFALEGTLSSARPADRCDGAACDVSPGGLAESVASAPGAAGAPDTTDSIPLTFTAPDKPGATQITAIVVGVDGSLYEVGPLTISYAGAADALSIAAPSSTILNVDSDGDRDELTLEVSAADSADNDTGVPTRRRSAKVVDGDGKTVSGIESSVVDVDSNNDGDVDKVEVRIDVTASDAIAAGDYTLQVKAGELEGSATITLAGDAANVALSSSGAPSFGSRVTITATVTDADGNAAADGTVVTWSTPDNNTLVEVSQSGATEAGAASAVYVVFGSGATFVAASAGSGSDVILIGSGAPATSASAGDPAAPGDSRVGLSVVLADSYSTWTRSRSTSASALHHSLGAFSAILKWTGDGWVGYSPGTPGSVDFRIMQGDVLWLSR